MENQKTLANINEEDFNKLVASIKEKRKEFGLDDVKFQMNRELVLCEAKTRNNVTFSFSGNIDKSKVEKSKEYQEELKKIFADYGGEDAYEYGVESVLGANSPFPPLPDLEVLPSLEKKNYEHPKGEVVLVDFWATWCGPCQAPMAHNQKMLEENAEKWKGKARIVAISFDDTSEPVLNRIKEKNWNLMEHYRAPGGFKSEPGKLFEINGIPTVVLVDKEGIIRFRGHPSEINLEHKINSLIDGKEEGETAEAAQKLQTLQEQIQKVKELEEVHNATKGSLQHMSNHYFVYIQSNVFDGQKESQTSRVIAGGTCMSDDTSSIITYLKNLLSKLPSNIEVQKRLSKRVLKPIHFGESCGTCKKALGKEVPHLICTACLNEGKAEHAFCHECADKELTQDIKHPKDLFHPHGLLVVDKDMEESLKNLKRTFNKFKLIDETHPKFAQILEDKPVMGCYCDGCGTAFKHCRYACANCGDFDFCPECYKISKSPDHENHAKLAEEMIAKAKHDVKTHAMYRCHFLCLPQGDPPTPVDF